MKIIGGFDTETSKIPNHFPWFVDHYLSLVSISYPNDTTRTWTFFHDENNISIALYEKQLHEIEVELNKFDIIAAHNLKFDLNILRGLKLTTSLHCTMVGEYLLTEQTNKGLKLDDLSLKYGLPLKIDKVKLMWDGGLDTAEIPLSILTPYCEGDAWKARVIAEKQIIRLKKAGLTKVFDLQMEWLDLLSLMECNGILWDMPKAHKIIAKYKKYQNTLSKKILKLLQPYHPNLDISLTSKDELSALIYGGQIKRKEKCSVIKTKNIKTQTPYIFTYKDGRKKIKLRWQDHPDTKIIRRVWQDVWYTIKGLALIPLPKTEVSKSTDAKKYYKTGKNVLPFLKTKTLIQKRIIKLLLKLSVVNKVITTFINEDKGTGLVKKIGRDGKLHTNYNQAVTITGRLSSSDPNSQNLPRGNTSPIKQCIIPRFDFIVNADLSQIEWRVPAFLSQDATMIREIKEKIDQHGSACTKLMGLTLNKLNRFYAKTFNFRMIYGGTEWGFHKDANMPKFGIKKWRQVVVDFYSKYRNLKLWQDKNINTVIQGDGTLTSPTGRRYRFKIMPYNGKYNEKQIKNYPVQGMAGGDILPLAAIIICRAMKKANMKAIPILTVHDSLVFDTPKNEVSALADICMKVFKNLPFYIKYYWGIDWNVPLTGEIEAGKTYGNMKLIRK